MHEEVFMTVGLSARELATVLAALRYWQQDLAVNEEDGEGLITSDHFTDQITPLTVDEIDTLCARLNCGPQS
jgi:hypothetical protein